MDFFSTRILLLINTNKGPSDHRKKSKRNLDWSITDYVILMEVDLGYSKFNFVFDTKIFPEVLIMAMDVMTPNQCIGPFKLSEVIINRHGILQGKFKNFMY